MSSGTVCKEVCSQCRCIVKEKPVKPPTPGPDPKNKGCQATIVGVINLPQEICDCCNNKPKPPKPNSGDDCKEVFRDMGECLQKCIVKVSKNSGGGGGGSSSNFC